MTDALLYAESETQIKAPKDFIEGRNFTIAHAGENLAAGIAQIPEGTKRVLMKGNEALAEAAIIAGCRHYFGYPITPQNENSIVFCTQNARSRWLLFAIRERTRFNQYGFWVLLLPGHAR